MNVRHVIIKSQISSLLVKNLEKHLATTYGGVGLKKQ